MYTVAQLLRKIKSFICLCILKYLICQLRSIESGKKLNYGLSDDNAKESARSGHIPKPGAMALYVSISALLLRVLR